MTKKKESNATQLPMTEKEIESLRKWDNFHKCTTLLTVVADLLECERTFQDISDKLYKLKEETDEIRNSMRDRLLENERNTPIN